MRVLLAHPVASHRALLAGLLAAQGVEVEAVRLGELTVDRVQETGAHVALVGTDAQPRTALGRARRVAEEVPVLLVGGPRAEAVLGDQPPAWAAGYLRLGEDPRAPAVALTLRIMIAVMAIRLDLHPADREAGAPPPGTGR